MGLIEAGPEQRSELSKIPAMAPVTRSQNIPMASASGCGPVDFTHLLPEELTLAILEHLTDYADVCRASVACKRLASLATCRLWRSLFVARWGPASATQEDAAVLAGSWRALFRSKHQTDATSGGWTRPCEFELQAALRRLASRAASAAASDPSSGKSKDPPSPAGPLSAAASAALSPAPSTASSNMSISMATSPPGSNSPMSSPFVHGGGAGGSSAPGSLHRTSGSISSAPPPLSGNAAASSSPFRSTSMAPPPPPPCTPGSSRGHRSSSESLSAVERTPSAPTPPMVPVAPPEVQLVYLLDGSGSVSEEDFAEMRKFVVSSANIICSALGCVEQGKVGVIQFSTEPRVEVPLTALGADGATQLTTALDNMVRMNGGTNIATAIARAGALLKAEEQQHLQQGQGAAPTGPPAPPPGHVAGGAPPALLLPPPPPPPPLGLMVEPPLPAELALMEALEDEDEAMMEGMGMPVALMPAGPGVALPAPPPGGANPGAGAGAGAGGPPSGVRPVRLLLILTDGRVDTYQAREARLNACRLGDELWGCTLAAFGVGRGVDRSELLHIIDTPQGDAALRYLDLYTRDDAPW